MTIRLQKLKVMVLGASTAIGLMGLASGWAQQSSASTNSPSRPLKKDALKQMEEDFFRPMKNLNSESSIENITNPQLPPPVRSSSPAPSRKALEQRDREKNWMLLSPDDLIPGLTPSEWLKLRQYDGAGQNKKSLSVTEKFYLNSQAEQLKHSRNQNSAVDSLAPEADPRASHESGDDNSLPAGLAERERSLKGIFHESNEGNPDDHSAKGNFLSDIFGLGSAGREKVSHLDFHKSRMDDYRQSLGLQPLPVSPSESYNPFTSLMAPAKATPVPTPRNGLPDGARAIDFNGSSAFSGTASAFTHANPLQDTTVRGYGSSSLAPAPPRTELPKPPPAASFSISKRPF